MQMLSADLDWCQKCGESEPGTDMNADAEELARYRAMFPVAPWDDGPITAEVCRNLSLSPQHIGDGARWMLGDFRMVLMENDGRVHRVAGFDQRESESVTAGQLACLVAARKAVRNDAG